MQKENGLLYLLFMKNNESVKRFLIMKRFAYLLSFKNCDEHHVGLRLKDSSMVIEPNCFGYILKDI